MYVIGVLVKGTDTKRLLPGICMGVRISFPYSTCNSIRGTIILRYVMG